MLNKICLGILKKNVYFIQKKKKTIIKIYMYFKLRFKSAKAPWEYISK